MRRVLGGKAGGWQIRGSRTGKTSSEGDTMSEHESGIGEYEE